MVRNTLDDLQGRNESRVGLLLLEDLGVQPLSDPLGDGGAIDLGGGHDWSGRGKGSLSNVR